MTLLDRVLSAFRPKSAEGAYRPGPYIVNTGILPHAWGQFWNYWQMGYDPIPLGQCSAIVEACVSAYAQTVAMCPLYHWREKSNGGRELVTTSALSRVNRAPNDYQSRSDFLLNLVRSLYLDGNGYALALRNDRFEIASLHGMHPRHCRAYPVGGEIFYELGGNSVIDSRIATLDLRKDMLRAVPARDVLHVKMHHVRDVLHGDSPLQAAAMSLAASNAALQQQIQFFTNQSRPSGVIQTDLALTKTQTDELRALWDEQVKGLNAGGTPILTHGLKWNGVTMTAEDAQLAEAMKLTDGAVAQVFRIPLAIVGSEAQPMGSTEALMNFWIAGGLGFALDRVELAFDKLFAVAPGEYSEMDTSVLLRSAFKDRMDALTRGVQGGVYSPNEARNLEGLPDVEGGDEPRVQQQLLPVSAVLEPTKPMPAAPAPAADPEERRAVLAYQLRKHVRQHGQAA
jgi:HK97 family phage portal protein